jgi:hypothetical protein
VTIDARDPLAPAPVEPSAAPLEPTGPGAPGETGPPEDGEERLGRWLDHPLVLVALVALAVAPLVMAGLEAARQTWYPAGDWADVALGAVEVGTRHTPLVGVYSRYGWNHPGPMMFWLYALPYRLMGGAFSGMILAAALINAAAVGGCVALAWRRGRAALASFTAVGLALVTHTLGVELLRDPWNPWVTVLPFGLLVMAAWAAGEGDRRALIVGAVVASFLAQSHIGFVPLVALFAVIAVVGFLRRTGDRRPIAVAAVVLAVCWLPVALHVVTGGDNVARLVEHFAQDKESAGLSYAAGVTALELGGRGPWVGAPEPGKPDGGGVEPGENAPLVKSLLAFAAAGALAWRRRRVDASPLRFLGVVGFGALAATITVSRISGVIFSYLIRWWWPLSALWWVAIAWAVWSALGTRARPSLRTAAVVALTAVFLVVQCVDTLSRDAGLLESRDGNAAQVPLAFFTDRVVPEAPTDRPVLYRQIGPDVGWVGDGLALQLIRTGRDVRFEDQGPNRFKYGADRITEPRGDQAALILMSGIGIEDLARMGGGRELGRWDPLAPAEREEAWRLQRHLRDQFSALGNQKLVDAVDLSTSLWDAKDLPEIDKQELNRFEELRARGEPQAVFLYERADTAPTRT